MASYLCVCVTVLKLYPNTTFTSETEIVSCSVCPTLCDCMDLPGSSDQARRYLLQEIFPTQESNQGLMRCSWVLYKLSYQGSPLEWVAMPFSRGSSWLRDWTEVSCIVSRIFIIWATGKPTFVRALNIFLIIYSFNTILYPRHWKYFC